MMPEQKEELYNPKTDPMFASPYIDIDEWREGTVRYHYIHGGFKGTDTRFAFFFPEKEQYQGRFYQFMCPVPGNENAAMAGDGEKITFAVTNGAYFVESNMGVSTSFGGLTDSTIIYRASAAAAEYSRQVAAELFGPHRPYGYVFGGSGGGYKSISCIENTAAWDGAAPFVIGSPMSIPYSLMVLSHCARILRRKLPEIIDHMEPGGSKDPYEGLNDEEKDAVRELIRFGVNPRSFFSIKPGQDGSLPVLAPTVKEIDPTYFTDFWSKPGYLGADANGSAVRDRLLFESTVASLYIPKDKENQNTSDAIKQLADFSTLRSLEEKAKLKWEDRTGVDDAWQRLLRKDGQEDVVLRLTAMPDSDQYIDGAVLKIISGALAGRILPIKEMTAETITLGGVFGADAFIEELGGIKPGDAVMLDNSDYIAMQTYYRHQIPESGYSNYDQYRDAEGKPLYPQRSFILGPSIAQGGAGSLQSGKIQGKVIVVSALLDGNLPWQADWYREQVKRYVGTDDSEHFRLWYIDNAVHSDEAISDDALHISGYIGVLYQTLLDLSNWVEKGIPPHASTQYRIENGQVCIPQTAKERMGIQPVVHLFAQGQEAIEIHAGETVNFEAKIEIPAHAGKLTRAEWSFEGEADFPWTSDLVSITADGVIAKLRHKYERPGVYFPTVRVSVHREGDAKEPFRQVKNLSRVRVTVK